MTYLYIHLIVSTLCLLGLVLIRRQYTNISLLEMVCYVIMAYIPVLNLVCLGTCAWDYFDLPSMDDIIIFKGKK